MNQIVRTEFQTNHCWRRAQGSGNCRLIRGVEGDRGPAGLDRPVNLDVGEAGTPKENRWKVGDGDGSRPRHSAVVGYRTSLDSGRREGDVLASHHQGCREFPRLTFGPETDCTKVSIGPYKREIVVRGRRRVCDRTLEVSVGPCTETGERRHSPSPHWSGREMWPHFRCVSLVGCRPFPDRVLSGHTEGRRGLDSLLKSPSRLQCTTIHSCLPVWSRQSECVV